MTDIIINLLPGHKLVTNMTAKNVPKKSTTIFTVRQHSLLC